MTRFMEVIFVGSKKVRVNMSLNVCTTLITRKFSAVPGPGDQFWRIVSQLCKLLVILTVFPWKMSNRTIFPSSYQSNPLATPCTLRWTKLVAFELLYESISLSRIASSPCCVVEQNHRIFPDYYNLNFLTYIWLTIILAIYSHKLCPFILPLTKRSPSITLYREWLLSIRWNEH